MDSRFEFNDDVVINFGKSGILSGKINAVKFTASKVYYDVIILPFADNEYPQILKEIDSYFIGAGETGVAVGSATVGIFSCGSVASGWAMGATDPSGATGVVGAGAGVASGFLPNPNISNKFMLNLLNHF
jgi:hypothetical protein